jgi:hypothetical protein
VALASNLQAHLHLM